MSVKKQILKTIGDHLMDKLKNLPDGLPDLKWFDKQMGQFDAEDASSAIPLPAVLMEYGPIVWQTTASNNQKGSGNLKFSIYYENYANSFTGSSDQDMAFQYLEFTEALHVALQGLGINSIMSALTRVGDVEDIEQDVIVATSVQYSITIFDNSTDFKKNYIDVADPALVITHKDESSRPSPENGLPAFLT